ncbi:sigma factor-like helix-turn-helix DNA-binding protein [Streptomyces bohaiensis]|uniref:sigma factor-like helix-turn-helix DNA-binding protein n=1 Tax=Streptomyces bohaiensis TaxID=1431344 RepID=UPI003B797798
MACRRQLPGAVQTGALATWRRTFRVGGNTAGNEPAHRGGFAEELALYGLLESLCADRREAFVLTQVCGVPYDEAAALCRCPVGTVRSRVSRARAELLRLLREAEGNAPGPAPARDADAAA